MKVARMPVPSNPGHPFPPPPCTKKNNPFPTLVGRKCLRTSRVPSAPEVSNFPSSGRVPGDDFIQRFFEPCVDV